MLIARQEAGAEALVPLVSAGATSSAGRAEAEGSGQPEASADWQGALAWASTLAWVSPSTAAGQRLRAGDAVLLTSSHRKCVISVR